MVLLPSDFIIPYICMATDNKLDTPGKRFNWFIEENYESVPKYVERFGFNASQVYRIIGDTTSPRFEKAVEYAATGINLHWMATGEGDVWWAPNDAGISLAKKKGIMVGGLYNQETVVTLDYEALLQAVFRFAEESTRLRINESEKLPQSIEEITAIILAGLSGKPAKGVKKASK